MLVLNNKQLGAVQRIYRSTSQYKLLHFLLGYMHVYPTQSRNFLFVLFILQPRSRVLKPDLIRLFFHPEPCFSLTNSSSIPPNYLDSSRIQTSEQTLQSLETYILLSFEPIINGNQQGCAIQYYKTICTIKHGITFMSSIHVKSLLLSINISYRQWYHVLPSVIINIISSRSYA